MKVGDGAEERSLVPDVVEEEHRGGVLHVLALVLTTLQHQLCVEESPERLGRRVGLDTVGVPSCRVPGIEESPLPLLPQPGEEDLAIGLAQSPHLPRSLPPEVGAALVVVVAVGGGPVEERLYGLEGQDTAVRRQEVLRLKIEVRRLEPQAKAELCMILSRENFQNNYLLYFKKPEV